MLIKKLADVRKLIAKVPRLNEAILLAYVQAHSGARGEDVAAGLGTDTRALRPVMHGLIDQRRLKTSGEARG